MFFALFTCCTCGNEEGFRGVVHGGGVGLWRWQRWQSLLVHGVWLEGRLGISRLGRESGTVHPYIYIYIYV